MADDTSKQSRPGRTRLAGGQGYEVYYFSRKHGITTTQAKLLLLQFGSDREKLNAAARKLSELADG